jgi:hypothetical protein
MMEEVTTGYAEQEAAGGSVGRFFKQAGFSRSHWHVAADPPGIAMCSRRMVNLGVFGKPRKILLVTGGEASNSLHLVYSGVFLAFFPV